LALAGKRPSTLSGVEGEIYSPSIVFKREMDGDHIGRYNTNSRRERC